LANCIITPHQSGFTRGDSAINQLLFITNEFGKALDEGKEIRVVFTLGDPSFNITPLGIGIIYYNSLFSIRQVIFIHDSKGPCIPIDSNFFSNPICQTLSKALLISQNTTLISFPSSKAFPNSLVMNKS
jgi:hypothetical protein